jgi:hypothetical protein
LDVLDEHIGPNVLRCFSASLFGVVPDVTGAVPGLDVCLVDAQELRCISRLLQRAARVGWNLNQSCCRYKRVDHGRDLLPGKTKGNVGAALQPERKDEAFAVIDRAELPSFAAHRKVDVRRSLKHSL